MTAMDAYLGCLLVAAFVKIVAVCQTVFFVLMTNKFREGLTRSLKMETIFSTPYGAPGELLPQNYTCMFSFTCKYTILAPPL